MKHVLTCLVVALACTLFLTYPTYAEEIKSEVEVLDFSGSVKNGGEVSVKSLPVFPEDESTDVWLEQVFKPFILRFNFVKPNPSIGDINNGNVNSVTYYSWFTMVKAVLVYAIPTIVGAVFFWWGLKKTISAIMSAFKRGKLKL